MSLILTQAQAESVYGAMLALNAVSAFSEKMHLPTARAHKLFVFQRYNGTVAVELLAPTPMNDRREGYGNQTEFANAYGLK